MSKLSKKAHISRLLKHRVLQAGIAIFVGLLLAAAVIFEQMSQDHQRRQEIQTTASHFNPGQPVPPQGTSIGGDFTLQGPDGKEIHNHDFPGKYLLIYFGYTYCPDMCPTGLQSIAHAMDLLGKDSDKVQPLFITIDPARDTSAKLKEYAANFHPKIIGLTGTDAQIKKAAQAYQVYYAKGENVEGDDYLMDHSSLIYLMNPSGKFITTFNEEADPEQIVKALQSDFKKSSSQHP